MSIVQNAKPIGRAPALAGSLAYAVKCSGSTSPRGVNATAFGKSSLSFAVGIGSMKPAIGFCAATRTEAHNTAAARPESAGSNAAWIVGVFSGRTDARVKHPKRVHHNGHKGHKGKCTAESEPCVLRVLCGERF